MLVILTEDSIKMGYWLCPKHISITEGTSNQKPVTSNCFLVSSPAQIVLKDDKQKEYQGKSDAVYLYIEYPGAGTKTR